MTMAVIAASSASPEAAAPPCGQKAPAVRHHLRHRLRARDDRSRIAQCLRGHLGTRNHHKLHEPRGPGNRFQELSASRETRRYSSQSPLALPADQIRPRTSWPDCRTGGCRSAPRHPRVRLCHRCGPRARGTPTAATSNAASPTPDNAEATETTDWLRRVHMVSPLERRSGALGASSHSAQESTKPTHAVSKRL